MALNIVGVVALLMSQGLIALASAFFIIGAAQSGYLMAANNTVVEFGHRHEHAMRMALSNTAESIVGALASLLGAGLAVLRNDEAACIATIISMDLSLAVLLCKVDEPRQRTPASDAADATDGNGMHGIKRQSFRQS